MDAIAKMPTYEAYKDSGYEWIGNVPSSWDISKLGSCLFPVSIKNHPDYPLLSITREQGVIQRDVENQDSNHNYIPDDLSGYKLLKEGQFGMNKMKAWQGSYGVSSFTGIVSPAYFVFDFIKPISPSFFNWAIRSKLYVSFFGSASDGVRVGQWDLSKSRMKIIPFLIPSTEEQTLIANFLDQKSAQIDEAIAIKEQQIALLKERKQIIIQKAVTQGLDPDVPMKDSGVDWIGEIPAHWEVVALAYALNAVGDVDHYMPETIDTGVPYFMTGDLEDLVSQMSFDDCKKVSYRDYNKLTKKIKTEVGDVILARYATIGTVTYVDVSEEFLVSYSCVTIKTDKKFLNGMYLFYFLKSDTFAQAVSKVVNTNTQGNVGIGDLKKIKIALPPLREQERLVRSIAKRLSEIDVVIEAQVNQITKLKEYKTTLINSAVTGKIRITPEMVA